MLPTRLQKGDTIGVIAPSDPIEEKDLEAINASITLMEGLGFHVQFGKHAFSNITGYGATAKEKAEDLQAMFENPEVKMVWCAKGGGNSNSVFDDIDYQIIQKNPKILCGFSDSTSILNQIYSKTGLITFHGPTFKSLTSWETSYAFEQFEKCLVQGKLEMGEKETYQTIQEGVAEGILVGGNLSLFVQLLAGKYAIDMQDKILFLEETGFESEPSMVSNHFYYMKQNGVFDKIRGIWLGNYEHNSGITLQKILKDCIGEEYAFPIIQSDNFGHIDKKAIIPIGMKAKIDTNLEIKIALIEKNMR